MSQVFIMTNPRSGSTWLQRVLTSTGDILIWGEGAESTFAVGPLWTMTPPLHNANDLAKFRINGADMFMATLMPNIASAKIAYAATCESLYGSSAKEEGFDRWGKKETSWEEKNIEFMIEMFPESKIIFLVRDFDMSFMSEFRANIPHPDRTRTFEVDKMASTWVLHVALMMKYSGLNPDRVKLVKYEDLYKDDQPNNELIDSLLDWCGIKNKPNWNECGTKISFHDWEESLDLRSYRPADLDQIWRYRDDVLRLSKQLGYEKVLGVEL